MDKKWKIRANLKKNQFKNWGNLQSVIFATVLLLKSLSNSDQSNLLAKIKRGCFWSKVSSKVKKKLVWFSVFFFGNIHFNLQGF